MRGRSVGCVGVPELHGVRVVGDVVEDALVPGRSGVGVEGVVGGGVVAGAARRVAGSVFLRRAFCAAVDVEPDGLAVGVDLFLRDVDGVEGAGAGGVAELPDECRELVVGGLFIHGEGEAGVAVVEDLEGCGRGGGACGIGLGGRRRGGFSRRRGRWRGFAADEEKSDG